MFPTIRTYTVLYSQERISAVSHNVMSALVVSSFIHSRRGATTLNRA